MIVLVNRGDGVIFGVAVPVVVLCLGDGDNGRCLLVEGNQVQRVVGCRIELCGEFGYIGICLRYNDNRGDGVGSCEVIGNGVIVIDRVFPLELSIVFGDGNHATERVGIVSCGGFLNEGQNGSTCVVCGDGIDNFFCVRIICWYV